MAGCGLDLPRYEDLSKEQDAVLNLPLGESHVVTGPPGSGKTVMAIYRADQLHKKHSEPAVLLMYNRLLNTYTAAATKSQGIDGEVKTYHTWFTGFFRRMTGEQPPQLGPYVFDWTACFERLKRAKLPTKDRVHMIVDEGQDMPTEFYATLTALSNSITVYADENQAIDERTQSTINEIMAVLGVARVHLLARNYRNSRPIAEVAAVFHPGVKTGIADMPADRPGDKPRLIVESGIGSAVSRIANRAKTFATECIGVFLPSTKLQVAYYEELSKTLPHPPQIYSSKPWAMKDRRPIDFAEPGIKVINYNSSKGLEFDSVFLPDLHKSGLKADEPVHRSKMYVMTSRARSNVTYQYVGATRPDILSLVPDMLLAT